MSDIVTLEDDEQVLEVNLETGGGSAPAVWGSITGQIDNQLDLKAKLDEKITNPEGGEAGQFLQRTADGERWATVEGGGATWGSIAGTLSNQTDLNDALNQKVDKVTGKGLSTNDFTNADKTKLDGIATGAEVNVQSDWNVTQTSSDAYIKNKPSIPSKTSDITNDSGFITASQAPVQGVKGSAESSYRTGSVDITKANIGLGNVDNTSDANKPISTAVQAALDTKQGTLTAGANIYIDANNVISASGSGGGAVDSVNGKTGIVILDAEDVGALPDTTTASDLGAYVKPSGGIPKTDLASAVQTSLDKADTALQTAPVTSVNTKTGAVVLSASDVGAYTLPSGGIPKSDLSSAVQTSLDKADTALQSAPVTSVNSKTGAVSLSASDVGALPDSTTIPTKTSDLTNDSGFLTSAVTTFNGQSGAVTYTAPVTSVDGKTGAVTVMPSGGTTGQVLTKTASGEAWQTPSGGGNVDTVNSIQPDANKNVQTVVELTQAQYDALVSPDPNVEYFITDGNNNPANNTVMASGVAYDNTDSGMTATNVQDAVDELNAGLIDFTLLANLTHSGTTYQLAESVENFKLVIAVLYYSTFYLNTVEIVKPLWLAGQNVICNFNDGTLRKGQFLINSNTSVTTTSTSAAWSNISGIYLYGVKG